MASSERIFINPEEIKNSASLIQKFNDEIKGCLADFTAEIESTDWEALGREAMRESFNQLKPSFEKFYTYISKAVSFLNQNVADDVITLDTAIQGNGSELRSRG